MAVRPGLKLMHKFSFEPIDRNNSTAGIKKGALICRRRVFLVLTYQKYKYFIFGSTARINQLLETPCFTFHLLIDGE